MVTVAPSAKELAAVTTAGLALVIPVIVIPVRIFLSLNVFAALFEMWYETPSVSSGIPYGAVP
jgi:hypothetical protein